MPNYKYQATTLNGKKIKGVMRAVDAEDLRAQLRRKKLYLLEQAEYREPMQIGRLKANQISEFCRELGAMLSGGVSLVRALNIMAQRDIPEKIQNLYTEMYRLLQQGLLLSEVMAMQGDAFPSLLIHMYRAGEESGRLDLASKRMADHYQKIHRLNKKVKSAMTYPAILLIVTLLVVLLIFLVVLPTFFTVFDSLGAQLPGITRFMLEVSQGLQKYWMWILIGFFTLLLIIRSLLQVPTIRRRFDQLKLKLPGVGKLLRIIYTARFARTLSSLYSSGISIILALQSTQNTVGNAYIASQFPQAIRRVRSGSSLSAAISQIDGFDKKLAATIQIGEETGKLDEMLDSVSDMFDYEADMATTQLTEMIGPVMVVLMAVLVGSIMISVMLPLMNMYDTIGGAGAVGGNL